MRHLVRTAVGKGVISNADGVYRFGSYTLGVDENSVIGKLTNEKEVLEMIEARIGFVDSETAVPQKSTSRDEEVSMSDLNKQARTKRAQ